MLNQYSKTALFTPQCFRTDTKFEDSMIGKIFMFQFVNSYASFFFLAFVAKYLPGGCGGDCMETLAINLGIIYGSRLVVGNIMELVIPYFSFQFKYRTKILIHGGKITRPEKEFMLDPVSCILT